jgi:uncharacterized membrane protein
MKKIKTDDILVGILIPLASVIGLIVGILWWTNRQALKKFNKVWMIFAVVGIVMGVYYSLAWIPSALKN